MALEESVREELQRIRAALAPGARIAALTGAGISAASGIPTFRGEQDSLWSRYRPEELATPGAFARDPDLVWGWYDWRRSLIARAAPNAAPTPAGPPPITSRSWLSASEGFTPR